MQARLTTRKRNNERNLDAVLYYCSVVPWGHGRPKSALENVFRIIWQDKQAVYADIKRALSADGYTACLQLLQARKSTGTLIRGEVRIKIFGEKEKLEDTVLISARTFLFGERELMVPILKARLILSRSLYKKIKNVHRFMYWCIGSERERTYLKSPTTLMWHLGKILTVEFTL